MIIQWHTILLYHIQVVYTSITTALSLPCRQHLETFVEKLAKYACKMFDLIQLQLSLSVNLQTNSTKHYYRYNKIIKQMIKYVLKLNWLSYSTCWNHLANILLYKSITVNFAYYYIVWFFSNICLTHWTHRLRDA